MPRLRALRHAAVPIVTAALLASVAAAASGAPAPPAGLPATAEEVPGAVVQAVNARSVAASPCSLMTRELRQSVALTELSSRPPTEEEPYGPDDVTRLCDEHVVRLSGSIGGSASLPRHGWQRTEVRAVRRVATRGDVVRLRAHVRHVFDPEATRGEVSEGFVSLYVVREEEQWRLADLDGLVPVGVTFETGAASIARFLSARSRRIATTEQVVRARVRLARELAASKRPVTRRTAGCGTGPRATASGRAEPSGRTVFDGDSGGLVRDRRAARADVVSARLLVGRGRMCWTVRFRRAPGPKLTLTFLLASRRDDDRAAEWTLSVADGQAVGVAPAGRWTGRAVPVRASLRGPVVRVVVPAARVRDGVPLRSPFGWSLLSRVPAPDGGVWGDGLPAFASLDDLAAIRHPR